MSALTEALRRSASGRALAVSAPAPRLGEVRREIERLFSQIAAKLPEALDLSHAWAALLTAKRNGNDVQSLDRRTLRHGPWVMFEGREGLSPLAADKGFAEAYVRRLTDDIASGAVINLAHAFLYVYPKRLLTFDFFAQAIPKLLRRCRTARCRRLAEYVEGVGLLRPEGPTNVWNHLLHDSGSVSESFEQVGLGGLLQRGGFGKAVLEEAMRSTQRSLRTNAPSARVAVGRLIDLSREEPSTSGRFRFPSHRASLVESLVLPFAEGAQDEAARRLTEAFVLEQYGDPRIDRSRWQGVKEEAVNVVLGWLVSETLEDFFRLIEHTAKRDPIASRHWRYRKAFWSAYLRAGVITDAWIVLASHLDEDAHRVLEINRKAYGRFRRGSGVQANHAALMLRIGNLVITDWSHSGSYRAWEPGRRSGDSPIMYKPTYSWFDLTRGADFEGGHHGAERGNWQHRLAEYIRDNTGIQVTYREMMPR